MTSEEQSKSYNRPMSIEETKRIMKTGIVLMVSALIFMAGFAILVHSDVVKLHPASTSAESLKGFAARVEYAFRYQTLLVFWLVFNIYATIYGRITTKALNPWKSEPSKTFKYSRTF